MSHVNAQKKEGGVKSRERTKKEGGVKSRERTKKKGAGTPSPIFSKEEKTRQYL